MKMSSFRRSPAVQFHLSNPLEMTVCGHGGQGSGMVGPLEGQQERVLLPQDPAS